MIDTLARPCLTEWRCPRCGRVLAFVDLRGGSTLRIKCHFCHSFNALVIDRDLHVSAFSEENAAQSSVDQAGIPRESREIPAEGAGR